MLRILFLTTALCAGVIAAGSASATPMPAGNLDAAVERILSDTVIPVHRYHRDCERGWVPYQRRSDWHRHRRGGRYIECRPRRYDYDRPRYNHPYRHRDGGCVNIGGVRICS